MEYIQFMELPAIGTFPDDWLENDCEILIDRTVAIARDYVRDMPDMLPPLMFLITKNQARTFLPTPDSLHKWHPKIGEMFMRDLIKTLDEDELIMFAFANEIFYMEAPPADDDPESAQEMMKLIKNGEREVPKDLEKKDGLMVYIETKNKRYHFSFAIDEHRHTRRILKHVEDRLNGEPSQVAGAMLDLLPKSKGGHE